MSLEAKIKIYCESNGVHTTDSDFKVVDFGSGQFIFEWGLSIPQPTQAQLDAITDDMIQADATLIDLAANGERYVLENQYILLCDALRQILEQAATQTAISESEFPMLLLTLKRANKDTYETIRDAFNLVTSKLVTKKIDWMDTVCWHPQTELMEASMAIMGLVK